MHIRVVALLGTDSLRAAQLAEASGAQDRLWTFIARFFEHQGPENSGYVTDAFLRTVAAEAGLDVDVAMAARGSSVVDVRLRRNVQRWMRSSLTGTPAFLIGPASGTLQLFAGDDMRPSAIEGTIQRAMREARVLRASRRSG